MSRVEQLQFRWDTFRNVKLICRDTIEPRSGNKQQREKSAKMLRAITRIVKMETFD